MSLLRRRLARMNGRWGPSPDTLQSATEEEALDAPWADLEPASDGPSAERPDLVEDLALDATSDTLHRLRAMIARVSNREAAKAKVRSERARASLPGQREREEAGELRVITHHLEPTHCHGRVQVTRALAACPRSLSKLSLDPRFEAVDLSRALFLDTETTGLGGGTGVVPFLIGLAWFEDGAMVVEQLLLEELGEEPAMLERVHARIDWASCIVTYNGKSYDSPLLDARRVLARRPPLPERPHLDLLHCSRRIYKPRLRQVRLVDMEAEVLGFRRERDVDGAEIPGLYWNYLRDGGAEVLFPVLEHNANDVAALASIMAVLAERYAKLHAEDDPRDQLARAKVGVRSGDLEKARAFATAAAEGGGSHPVAAEAFELVAKLEQKQGDLTAARVALEQGIACVGEDSVSAAPLHLALAKLLEHRLKAPDAALRHARFTLPIEGPEAQGKRVARLEARLARLARAAARTRRPGSLFESAG